MLLRKGESPGLLAAGARAPGTPRLALRLPRDPGLAGLRRAARAALVMPAAFAFAKLVIGDAQVATFVSFGCFAHLVMGDFGGLRLPRARAYLCTTIAGAALVALGTLASPSAWVAALAMLAVGFCIQFAGVFGGYVAAAQLPLQLSFVLAVSVPAPTSAVGARLAGWGLAGALSVLAGVFLWPRFERVTLRRQAADACRALAALLAAERGHPVPADVGQLRQTAQTTVEAARRSFAATPKRPAGAARRDRAFVELLNEQERILALVTGPLDRPLAAHHPCIEAGHALAGAVTRTLEAAADALAGGPAPDLAALQEARRAHREELDRWAGEALRAGEAPSVVFDDLQADDALRIVSYLALALGSNAIIASGGQVPATIQVPAETPRAGGVAGVALRVAGTIRTHLAPTSSVLHAGLRTGIGLGLAVLLTRLLQLDHAFWVVLGTLSVLRSNALATGRTVLQALEGTVAGFALGAIFIVAVGTHTTVLWIALPILVFIAAYAASAIGFVAGQIAFTIVIIALYNLIAPAGWRLGLARIEDVAIGTAISLVVGVLLWPRGARGELRQATAALYRAVAAFLDASFTHVLERDAPLNVARARSLAAHAYDRAAEAFEQFLRERGAKPLDPLTASSIVAPAGHAIVAGDLLNGIAEKGYQAQGHGDAVATLHGQATALVATFRALADQLATATHDVTAHATVSDEALRDAAVQCLGRWKGDPAQGRAAVAVVTVAEWIHLLGELAASLERPVATAVEVARVPWWR